MEFFLDFWPLNDPRARISSAVYTITHKLHQRLKRLRNGLFLRLKLDLFTGGLQPTVALRTPQITGPYAGLPTYAFRSLLLARSRLTYLSIEAPDCRRSNSSR